MFYWLFNVIKETLLLLMDQGLPLLLMTPLQTNQVNTLELWWLLNTFQCCVLCLMSFSFWWINGSLFPWLVIRRFELRWLSNCRYLEHQKWQIPLYEGSDITLLQALLLLSAFVARYSITNDALQNLLIFFKIFLPMDSVLPETTFLFKKFLPDSKVSTKYYCPKLCNKKNSEILPETFECSCSPDQRYSKTTLIKKQCYYFMLSVADQLKCLFQDLKLSKFLKLHRRTNAPQFVIGHVYDGRMYK